MVYCSKCGAKNEDDAEVCATCGAPLYGMRRMKTRREDACFGPREERRVEEECFGLPYGGAIVGLIFGIIIVILGALWIISPERNVWQYIGPLIVILIGILIVVSVIYRLSRRS